MESSLIISVNAIFIFYDYFKNDFWDFPGGPVVKTALPLQGPRVQSLVGELKSYMPWGQKTKQNKKTFIFF